jgi:hypothetical protein
MNWTTLKNRMCALVVGLSLVGFMYVLPGLAVAAQEPVPARLTPDMTATSNPDYTPGLAFVHNGSKASTASVRGSADTSGLSALLPPSLTPRVPEPGTLGLLAIGATFLLRRRRR